MMGLFLDEIETGQVFELGDYAFTQENIDSFCERFAPLSFHMSESAAAAGLFGKKSAAGFHICSAWMPCFVKLNKAKRAEREATGQKLPEIGAGFGLHDIKWTAPVFPGDVLAYRTTIVSKRDLKSKPGWGIVEQLNEGLRDGVCIVRFGSKMLVQTR